jgi:predicted MFS family arabinose efflux permease
LTTVLVVPYALAQVPGGLLGSMFGIGRTFAVAFGLVAVGFLGAAAVSGFPLLLASRALAGLGAGMLLPLGSALARTVAPAANTRAQGVLGSGWGLGYLIGLFALPLAVSGWRAAFIVVGVAAAVAALVALLAIPQGPVTAPATVLAESGQALIRRRVLLCGLCLLGMTFVNVGLGAWVSAFLHDDLALSKSAAAWLTALIGCGLLPASIVGAVAARGGRERRVVVVSCVGLAAVPVVLAVGRPLGLVAVALFGLGWFSAFPFGVILGHVVAAGGAARAETQGILTGAVNGMGFVAGGIAPPLIGLVRDSTGSFAVAFLVLLIGPAVALAAGVHAFDAEQAPDRGRTLEVIDGRETS